MKPAIIGIDPGRTGGVAMLDVDGALIDGWRMPTLVRPGTTATMKARHVVDGAALFTVISRCRPRVVVVEAVHAMPRQGVVSSFSFGKAAGAAEAIAMACCTNVVWVAPATWKKHFGLGSDKEASVDLAKRSFGVGYRWTKRVEEGIAEAALIALWHIQQEALIND